MNDVGNYIKSLRLSKGLTQEELGSIVGVKKAAVQKWESGIVTNLKRNTIQALAEYFNVSPASFVGGDTSTDDPNADLSTPPNGEQQLIELYRQLNPEGQEKVTDYADDLVNSGKYKKSDTNGMDKKEA